MSTAFWCFLANYLVKHSFLANVFRSIGSRVLPYVLIGLGIYIGRGLAWYRSQKQFSKIWPYYLRNSKSSGPFDYEFSTASWIQAEMSEMHCLII